MSLTFIDTNRLPKVRSGNSGEVTEVLSKALCGAQNVQGSLRWLKAADKFQPESADQHQLIYVMEGEGRIRLGSKAYPAEKGMGVYLGPSETTTIEAKGNGLKLFHLVVPKIPQ